MIQCSNGPSGSVLLVVRGASEESSGSVRIAFVPSNDARKKEKIVRDKNYFRSVPDGLRKWGARKAAVNPLGEVTEAHD
jgi:hypothetical protein